MRAKNLDDSNGMVVQEWSAVTTRLDKGFNQAPDSGGPNRYTTWLTTINPTEKITDRDAVSRVVAAWNDGGWPCEVDESGTGITAPFNAPATGPPPWFVYRITPTSALSVSTVEPGGSTRWTF
jgi:hypothetical protein